MMTAKLPISILLCVGTVMHLYQYCVTGCGIGSFRKKKLYPLKTEDMVNGTVFKAFSSYW